MIRFIVIALATLLLLEIVRAQTAGNLPLRYALTDALTGNRSISISGNVADGTAALTLRIDDAASNSYASRANIERSLLPGPFHWDLGVNGLRASSGRVLDLKTVRALRLFSTGAGRVSITSFAIQQAEPLAPGALAYSFGEADAPLFPGFERISPKSPMIVAGHATAILRPGPDPLIASGIAGIETMKIAWAQPRARVTLWTEDPGEWETLPHPLQRRIRVNGIDVLYQLYKPDEWLQKRYLRGLSAEHTTASDAWTAYGQKRGATISFETEAGSEGIKIELAGDSPAATFLNAIVIEKAGQTAARDEAERRRAAYYRSMWPIAPSRSHISASPQTALKASAAPGTGLHLTANFFSALDIPHPNIAVEPPALGRVQLGVRIWAAQTRLERTGAGDTLLTLSDNMLRADTSALPLRQGQSRKYDLWVNVPAHVPAGTYRGALRLGPPPMGVGAAVATGNNAAETVSSTKAKVGPRPGLDGAQAISVEIEVLPIALPPVGKPAGFYLDEAPQWSWFWGMNARRKDQLACDLALLDSFGIEGNAPALSTPIAEGKAAFVSDMQIAAAGHTSSPWLAYAPAKRLFARVGALESAALLKDVEVQAKAAGLTPPVWGIADEPSNANARGFNLIGWVRDLRALAPGIRLAAQLNTPADAKLAPLFDTVIVNQGFGIDENTLAGLTRSVADVWLYNTGRPRATAGLWLWLTPARRYLQWHARMPAADPFDPLDGREGDVQMIFPSPEACPLQNDIHRGLLHMAEGLIDQRWLLWLAGERTPEAETLTQDIRRNYGGSFERVSGLNEEELNALRESVVALARKAALLQR